MKRIEDLPEELQRIFQQVWYKFESIDEQFPEVDDIAEFFFIAGYEAAIAERAEFDEQRIDNWARMVLKDRQKRNKRK